MARAAPVPVVQYAGFQELPAYERHTSFERGMRLDEPTPDELRSRASRHRGAANGHQ